MEVDGGAVTPGSHPEAGLRLRHFKLVDDPAHEGANEREALATDRSRHVNRDDDVSSPVTVWRQ